MLQSASVTVISSVTVTVPHGNSVSQRLFYTMPIYIAVTHSVFVTVTHSVFVTVTQIVFFTVTHSIPVSSQFNTLPEVYLHSCVL